MPFGGYASGVFVCVSSSSASFLSLIGMFDFIVPFMKQIVDTNYYIAFDT